MLKRRLVFYKWAPIAGKPAFIPHAAASQLESQIAADENSSIVEKDGVITAVEVVDVGSESTPTNLRLFALRNPEDRPFKWDPTASASPISLLDSEYTADVTHVSIWPDGHCAHDSWRNSPRFSRLAFFLRQRLNSYASFDPLYKEDMVDRLKDLQGQLRSVEIAMTKPEWISQDRGVFGTLIPTVAGEKTPSVRVSLGMGRYGRKDRYLDNETEEEIFTLAENADEYVSNMIIKGRNPRTGRVETINLLNERLQHDTQFDRSATIPSMPDGPSVFHELDQVYKDFRGRGLLSSAVRGQKMRSS
ncbi:hypothetical protein ACWDD9_40135 [Kitasatospora sp. NPDC001119]